MIAPLLVAAFLAAQDTSRLTLETAVRRALDSQPGVAAARYSRDAAGAAVGEARAPLFPRLSASLNVNRYQLPYIVYPLHGLPPAAPTPLFDRTTSQAALSLGYTLFDFGARTSQLRLAKAQERRADAALDAAASALVARVANAYLRVLTTHDLLGAQDLQIQALQAESDRVARLQDQGKAARVEVLRVAAEVSRARADRVGTQARLEVAERELAQLAGLPVESVRAAHLVPLRLADTTVAARDRLVALASGTSPDVEQARRSAEAASAAVGVSRSTLLPTLNLQAAYLDYGRSLTFLHSEWNAALQFSWPIFTGGGRISAIHRTEADARAARERLRGAQQAAEQSVDGALATLSAARASVDALTTAVAQSEEVERIRKLSLEVGSGTETDYLEAEATLLQTRARLVDARHGVIAARIELARLTGELTPDWLARMLPE